jgi:threonine synthase
VGHPSNLARLIDLYGGHIDESGVVHKNPNLKKMRKEIVSYSIDDALTKKTINDFYEKYNKIIEPHGAVGWAALQIYRYKFPEDNNYKSITLETADPAKFPEEIVKLIKISPKMPESLATIQIKKEYPNPIEIKVYEDFKNYLKNNY